MRFDRRLITNFEWILPLLALAVSGLGVLCVYSATHDPDVQGPAPLAVRQLTWLAAGCIGMLAMLLFDYRRVDRNAYIIYAIIVLAVLAVPLFGRMAGGSRRWLTFGPVSIQPSEFMKLGMVIVLARYYSRTAGVRLGLGDALIPLAMMAVPAFAVLLQPDLGSASMIGIISVTMLVMGGVKLRWFALLGSPIIVLAPLLWGHLKPYQQQRILTFINPDLDPLGAGYHVTQSKIAVGSGMLWGKGFLHGTQNHLNFLPEQHTDFIFSVWAEEWGFVGAMTLIALYLAICLRGIVIAGRARDRFGMLFALGMTGTVFWSAVVNVGMTTGLLPVVGVPLPLFSYGGSSLLCLLLGIGLMMNLSMRRSFF